MKKIDKDVLTVLQKTRELIRSPRNWTQFVTARDVESHYVPYNSVRAVKWHVCGALLKNIDLLINGSSNDKIATFWDTYNKTLEVLKEVAWRHGLGDLLSINDAPDRKKAFHNIRGILNHAINSIKKNVI